MINTSNIFVSTVFSPVIFTCFAFRVRFDSFCKNWVRRATSLGNSEAARRNIIWEFPMVSVNGGYPKMDGRKWNIQENGGYSVGVPHFKTPPNMKNLHQTARRARPFLICCQRHFHVNHERQVLDIICCQLLGPGPHVPLVPAPSNQAPTLEAQGQRPPEGCMYRISTCRVGEMSNLKNLSSDLHVTSMS